MKFYVALFLFFVAAAPSMSQWCLYNREDVLPCTDYYRRGVASPRANQYTVHATRFRRNTFGYPVCVLRKDGELVADIEDLGTPDVKFLFSPGAERSPNINYANQMVAEYNVQCQAGQLAFIQFDSLDLEPKNCLDGTLMRCQDYVEIDAGAGGRSEFCGSSYPKDPLLVGTGKFTLKMRTSFLNSYSGFRISVICFKQEEQKSRPNCIDSSDKINAAELVDLSASTGQTHSSITLTSTEKKTLENLADSLYATALRQARNKIASWPPSSYSQNEIGDILDISELGEPTLPPINIPILPPVDKIKYPPFIDEPQPIIGLPVERELAYRRKRSPFGGQDRLNSKAIMEAVRNVNSCNSIVHSATKSYLRVAQRLEPRQLEKVQQEYQLETSQHLNNNLLAAH